MEKFNKHCPQCRFSEGIVAVLEKVGLGIAQYEWLKAFCALRYCCHYIVKNQPETKFDYRQLSICIAHDTQLSVAPEDIKADTKQELYEKLVALFYPHTESRIPWELLVAMAVNDNDEEDFGMEVYEAVNVNGYIESHMAFTGNTLIGINISGTLSVGEDIVVCTTDGGRYKTQVKWIERDGMKVETSMCGNTIGIGIDIPIPDGIVDFVYKYDEVYHEDEELTPEEQEYVDEYEEIISKGEPSPRDQRYLNKLKELYNISDERAEKLEAMVEDR